ncbi:MAG TPA: glycosyltransferase family 2 protein [Dehalococcoidia bacterium]|nr:glycosyltransferase family 2 protein [Dehalococcoidia bacterium]
MPPKLVSINILNTNERHYLGRCLDAIGRQTYPNLEVAVLDNGSTDGSVEFVRAGYPQVRVIENGRNLGYAPGHNVGIRACSGEYVMPLNTDIFLRPEFVAAKVAALEQEDRIWAVEGKLLRYDPNNPDHPETDQIDSVGLILRRSRRNFDPGQGEIDRGQYDRPEPVFGASGSAPLYRRSMLEDIRYGDEYFDASFFIYREEVDLAWRAQLRGWRCVFTPDAVAYHVRGFSPQTRRRQSRRFRRLSFRNRYLMLLKNDTTHNLRRDWRQVGWFELLQAGHVLLREPHLLLGWWEFLTLAPGALCKRCRIQSTRVVGDDEIHRWFG